jgi:hypothetical protein
MSDPTPHPTLPGVTVKLDYLIRGELYMRELRHMAGFVRLEVESGLIRTSSHFLVSDTETVIAMIRDQAEWWSTQTGETT